MTAAMKTPQRALAVVAIALAYGAMAPARAQDIHWPPTLALAYTQFSWLPCYCPTYLCDLYCEYPQSSLSVVTPFWQTSGPADSSPAWSPDASHVAFTSNFDTILVMDAQGSTTSLISGASVGAPAWSPDGRRIAFVSNSAGEPELYTINLDGSNLARVTIGLGVGWSRPTWSPDSTRLAFDCEVEAGNQDICAINTDGASLARLTSDPGSDMQPAWSPDGARIAFTTARYDQGSQLALMNADGSNVSAIPMGIPGWDAAWSPDGRQIAFDSGGTDWTAIYTAKADGTGLTLFADDAGTPAWMPVAVMASFSINCTDLTCVFDGSSSIGTISDYAWSFGDQTTGSGPVVAHTYSGGGNFTIALRITDAQGVSANLAETIYLYLPPVNLPPVASFTVACDNVLRCVFNWSGSRDPDGALAGTEWNFGAPTSSVVYGNPLVTVTYTGPGTYTATLRVTDNFGATALTSQTFTVPTPPMHVGDLDASIPTQPGRWSTWVTITVHNADHAPLANATVGATWEDGTAASCTTNAAGACFVSRSRILPKATVRLTVTSIALGSFVYSPSNNHDPDGDSNGTTINISRQ